MFIEIKPNQINDHYVLYKLTAVNGAIIQVNVVRYSQLMTLNNMSNLQNHDVIYFSMIATDINRVKLINHGISWLNERNQFSLRDELIDTFKSWSAGKKIIKLSAFRPVRFLSQQQ